MNKYLSFGIFLVLNLLGPGCAHRPTLQKKGVQLEANQFPLVSTSEAVLQRPIALGKLRRGCIEFKQGQNLKPKLCGPLSIRKIRNVQGQDLYLAQYNAGIAVFATVSGAGVVFPIWAKTYRNETDLTQTDQPQIFNTKFGQVIRVPRRAEGSLDTDNDIYFIASPSSSVHWEELDWKSWVKHLKIPAPLSPRLRNIDLQTMSSSLFLERQDDPVCCPSGGKIQAKLAIDGNHRVIATSYYLKP